MIRKSNYMEYIDRYLSHELTGDELREFNEELAINPDMLSDIELSQDVEDAVQEKEIMDLREKLQSIADSENEKITQDEELEEVMQKYDFELSEDLSSINEFKEPVTKEDLKSFIDSLPILHMSQHKMAEKENIHHFYREQNLDESTSIDDEFDLTPQDQAILEDVAKALDEKEITRLRADLQQIAMNMPAHKYTNEEIEDFTMNELDDNFLAEFERELEVNQGLAEDVELYGDINMAASEKDIIGLRESLNEIKQTEVSISQRTEEIDKYINNELSDSGLQSFETELLNNPDLAEEVKLHNELDLALSETDIINLRAKLGVIGKESIENKNKELSYYARFKKSRILRTSIAAALALLLGITGVMNYNRSFSDAELYDQYFTAYNAVDVFRSGNAEVDGKVNLALKYFNENNYDTALSLFNEILSVNQDDPVGNFYTGMAYQETEKYDKAIDSYQKVVELKNNLFVEQAEWYIGLCYLQTDEKKKASDAFKRIVEAKGYYSQKAEAILQEMKYLE